MCFWINMIWTALYQVSPELAKKILKWNKADYKLYDHFNKTFWNLVDDYGRDKMANDLETFKTKQKEAEQLCVAAYQPFKKKPWMLGAKLKPKPSLFCKHLAWSETVYGEHLRDKMYHSIPGLVPLTDDEIAKRNNLFDQVASDALQKDWKRCLSSSLLWILHIMHRNTMSCAFFFNLEYWKIHCTC